MKIRSLGWVFALLVTLPVTARSQETSSRRLYFVPSVHYGSLSRASVGLTAFLDGRRGVIGKGNVLIVEGGRDAFKSAIGIANVSSSPLGYSMQLGFLRALKNPIGATPNTNYAGAELHLLVTILNLGVGYYAPVGAVNGRRGHLSLSAGIGF